MKTKKELAENYVRAYVSAQEAEILFSQMLKLHREDRRTISAGTCHRDTMDAFVRKAHADNRLYVALKGMRGAGAGVRDLEDVSDT